MKSTFIIFAFYSIYALQAQIDGSAIDMHSPKNWESITTFESPEIPCLVIGETYRLIIDDTRSVFTIVELMQDSKESKVYKALMETQTIGNDSNQIIHRELKEVVIKRYTTKTKERRVAFDMEIEVNLLLKDLEYHHARVPELIAFSNIFHQTHVAIVNKYSVIITQYINCIDMYVFVTDFLKLVLNASELKSQKMAISTMHKIAVGIIPVLQYLHDAHNVTYYDVKLENILVTTYNWNINDVYLCDFGLSSRVPNICRGTTSTVLCAK